MKKIVILGSTGSIGTQTVEIVKKYPERFEVVALSAHKNIPLLRRQIEELGATRVVLTDLEAAQILSQDLRSSVSVMAGVKNLEQLAALPEVDIVVNALVGSVGLDSTLAALKNGKTLALANKESLVAGGELVKESLKNQGEKEKTSKKKGNIIPVDSEHNAIFQCLVGESSEQISRVLLTGSGGPFRETKI
ncbi:MAG TPA: 1-deoxy-D-xylulose-5-phosphate reductoisomerase, partial [Candidatus Subteraquimicrobiales bacterium]